ncbi:MAG: hypothetical protein KAH32_00025, partial [Chlamydiia bacterium]|nr:hypothetical protein [Chlamydiia bacterium]
FVLVIAVMSVIFVAGCKDETTEVELSAVEILTAYLDASGMSIGDLTASAFKAPDSTFQATLSDYYIMDIRAADLHGATAADDPDGIIDYDNGHIPGAVSSSFGNIVTDAANAGGKPIIVVCYTGQSAGHAVMALRLSGYTDARVMKWGMSGWHSDFDKWTGNCSIGEPIHANWVAAPGDITDPQMFDLPDWESDLEDGAEILAERVALITAAFNSVSSIDVLDTPADYFINNYWAANDVVTYGNIDTAYRINPLVLENLDPDPSTTVVTYCWTGHNSSMITAYLTLLGYNAKSLTFGVNGMIYDNLAAEKQWSASMDYTYEVTTP